MSTGFRKSLFGFNCNDVIEYIEKSHKSFLEKEKSLNVKVDELCHDLKLTKAESEKLAIERNELAAKLSEFKEKYDEIERLSENIGKLYLVAQANAQAIMESSQNSAKAAEDEVYKNLYTIDEAHTSLKELRASITKTSDDFVAEVDRLISSLTETREQIAANTDAKVEAARQFEEIYSSIVK